MSAQQQPIVVERTYRATVEEVWDLWTTRDGFASWWGPEDFRVDVHAFDARVGGELRYDMVADTPAMVAAMAAEGRPPSHPTRGRFAELEPHRRLRLVHLIDFLPGVEPYENLIDVELFPAGDQVRMVVTLHGLHDEAHSKMQLEGFTSQLRKLDRRFAR